MARVEKSFTTLGLEGILQGVVACLVDAEKKAKSSREIQSIDVSRRGLRQDLYVGKLMVIPASVMDEMDKIPDPLLKGAVISLFDGEDASYLEMHRLSTSEFDNLTPKDISEYKDKVFKDSEGKLGCIVIFQPAWGNARDLHAFHFTTDVPKLTLLVRHLVFSAYYNPSLSALFDTLSEEAIKLDAVNITHDHIGPAYEFQSKENVYPQLDKMAKIASIMKMSPDEFTTAYLEAAVWTGTDETGESLDREGKFSIEDFSTEALRKAEEDCTAFMEMAGPELDALSSDQAGHLFWLNRNGHGTGFWDEDKLSPEAQQSLDKLAHSFGECDMYVSEDGELELSGGQIPAPTPQPGSGHILPKESKWIRLNASALPLILADKITPEETSVFDELTIQLKKKTANRKIAEGTDTFDGYCPICGSPGCQGECSSSTGGKENFEERTATGDAGSVRIPTSPNTGTRAEEDFEQPGSQPTEEEPVHFGSLRMAAFLEKIASGEVLNGYTQMRETFKSDFASKDEATKETDHEGTIEKQAALPPPPPAIIAPAPAQAAPVTGIGAKPHSAVLNAIQKALQGAGVGKGSSEESSQATELLLARMMANKSITSNIKKTNEGQFSITLTPEVVNQLVNVYKLTPGQNSTAQKDKPELQTEVSDVTIDSRPQWYKDKMNVQSADQEISSAANQLVEQHHGEYLSKENLTRLLSHMTNNVKAVFSFLTQQGLLQAYGKDSFKVMTRTEQEDNSDSGVFCPNCAGPGVPMGNLGGREHFRCRNCGSDFSQKMASDTKVASTHKMALTYMHPGEALEQFYPEILKDTSDYPIGYPERNSTPPPLPLELQNEPGGESQVTDKDYSDGGMKHSLGEPGLVPSQDSNSVPLKPNERSIRGPFFSDQFYRIHTDIEPALLTMKSSLENKTAASPSKAAIIAEFLRKLSGEIASSLLAAFVVTDRPLFTNSPSYSVINLSNESTICPMNPLLTSGGMSPYVAQFKSLLSSINSGELTEAINNAWAQGGVWHDGPDGRFLYEIFVRIEKVDIETLDITYKYITGTKE
jgi:hypothetical protein